MKNTIAKRERADKMKRKDAVEVGSGNVFADLGLPNAEELSTRAHYALAILQEIRARGLRQKDAAALLGIDQPKVSAIVNARLDGFSAERLEKLLKKLGANVDVRVQMPVSFVKKPGYSLFRMLPGCKMIHGSDYQQTGAGQRVAHRFVPVHLMHKHPSNNAAYRSIRASKVGATKATDRSNGD